MHVETLEDTLVLVTVTLICLYIIQSAIPVHSIVIFIFILSEFWVDTCIFMCLEVDLVLMWSRV